MNVRDGLDGLRALPPGAVVTVGNFDGVHLGHQAILRRCAALRTAGLGGGSISPPPPVAVVTFEPHPLTVLRPEVAPPRLATSTAKRDHLAGLGVDECVVLPPTPEVLGLDAEAFWHLLRDDARVGHIVEGEGFTFGKGRGGTMPRLRAWAAGTSVGVHVVPPVTVAMLDQQVAPVSSSLVRFLVAGGRMRDAAACLGRPYALSGPVVKGYQRGRTIGVPTANLDCGDQLVPADGVYAARCTVGGTSRPVALSIGTMPTFGDGYRRQVEAFILDFDGDLYGQTLTVELLDWVREQWKLPGLDALKKQIALDVGVVRRVFADPRHAWHHVVRTG
ncbi:MAG: ribF [Phycisphaerales bacterium]|nr:ribF [Phycisphaerales bacterium]